MPYKYRYLMGIIVLMGTSLVSAHSPEALPVITEENATQVELQSRVGSDSVFQLEWSPDGTQIVVAGENGVALYDVDHFNQPPQIIDPNNCREQRHEDCRPIARYTPDGHVLMVTTNDLLTTYDVATGQSLASYNFEFMSPILSNVAYDTLKQRLTYINGLSYNMSGTAFIEDFDILATNETPEAVRPFDFQSPTPRSHVSFTYSNGRNFTLSTNKRYIAEYQRQYEPGPYMSYGGVQYGYSSGSEVVIYDLEDVFAALPGREETYSYDVPEDILNAHRVVIDAQGEVMDVAFSLDGTLLATADIDGTVRLWRAADGSAQTVLHGHYGGVWDVDFSADGKTLASASADGTIRLWDLATGKTRHTVKDLRIGVTALDFSPDGSRIAAAGWDGSLWMIDAATGQIMASRPGHWGIVERMAINPQGTLLAAGNENNEVVLYDILNTSPYLNERMTLIGHKGIVYGVDFSADGTQIASGASDGTIIVWDVQTGQLMATYPDEKHNTVYDVAFHPEGYCLVAGTRAGYRVVDFIPDSDKECVTSFPYGLLGEVPSVAFVPHSNVLLLGQGDGLHILGTQYLQVPLESPSYNPAFNTPDLEVARDGSSFLYNGTLWRMNDLMTPLNVGGVTLNADGSLVVDSALNITSTLPLEATPAGEEERWYWDSEPHVIRQDALFTPDGRLIITVDETGTFSVWGVVPKIDDQSAED